MNKTLVISSLLSAGIGFAVAWVLSAQYHHTSAMAEYPTPPLQTPQMPQLLDNIALISNPDTSNEEVELIPRKEAQILEQLVQQNNQLEARLAQQNKESAAKIARLDALYTSYKKRYEAANHEDWESVSEEEAQKVLPQPFADMVSNARGTVATQFKALQNQEQDYDWALLMEQRISDFFIGHELSYGVEIQSVICKTSICEVRGFEKEDKAYGQILSNMSAQPWWEFNSTHSSSSNNDEYGRFFYMLSSKNPPEEHQQE